MGWRRARFQRPHVSRLPSCEYGQACRSCASRHERVGRWHGGHVGRWQGEGCPDAESQSSNCRDRRQSARTGAGYWALTQLPKRLAECSAAIQDSPRASIRPRKQRESDMYVTIGDIEQWIQVDEDNPANPVLLFLHGGPGGTSIPAAMAWKPWHDHFTLVHWDQRGAGQTFQRNGELGCGPLTLERMVEDGIEVAEYLRSSLKKEKILVVGHSWGAILGIHIIKRRPDLFSAFVATGMLVNFQKTETFIYQRLLTLADHSANAEALTSLTELGPPPYADRASFLAFLQWIDKLAEPSGDGPRPHPVPPNPDITPAVGQAIVRGAEYSRTQLFPHVQADRPAFARNALRYSDLLLSWYSGPGDTV